MYIKDHGGKMCQNIDLHKAMISLNMLQYKKCNMLSYSLQT